MDSTTEASRCIRNIPPVHYLMKVESYSLLSNSNENYHSSSFQVGDYKWRLSFYPNGDKSLPSGWEVNVNFTLLVYNHKHDNYLTFQGMRRFHELKKEWGFEQIESLETFKDVCNGYLFNDSCAFGADVFVMKHTLNSETLSVFRREDLTNPTFRWEIKEFSKMDKSIISKKFCSGETHWYICSSKTMYLSIYPNGKSSKDGKAFSIFLSLDDDDDSAHNNSTIYAEFYLRVIDQLNSKHEEGAVNRWFSGCKGWGVPEFMLLEDLHKSSNGYIVKDSLIVKVEVEFSIMSRTKSGLELRYRRITSDSKP
ncbi:hypothetical protein F8388_012008 [Cannabis sativa]|uniref:MATH domain-containing protein n=1 Tax=Cannabis sativa TaxID=3483 RepID=A0A7J6GDR5_CANSA|nr:hypothetical protein F8388_012008 [Cannabis sativa]